MFDLKMREKFGQVSMYGVNKSMLCLALAIILTSDDTYHVITRFNLS
ncbi:hypothetical protein ACHAWF_008065 [Thalassiosira exigua]